MPKAEKLPAVLPNPREVRDTFTTLINDNDKAIGELEASIRDVQRNRDKVEGLYNGMIDRFAQELLWPSLDEERLADLKSSTGGRQDFLKSFQQQTTESREAEIRLTALTATHGEASVLESRMRDLQKEANNSDENARGLGRAVASSRAALAPVEKFNADAGEGAPKLDEKGQSYFTSKTGIAHLWSWAFNGHYRRGRAILKELDEKGSTIPGLQKHLAEAKESYAAANARTAELAEQKLAVEKPLREIKATAAKVQTEEQIVKNVKNDILALLKDRNNFNKAVKALGPRFPAHAVELRAKLEGFDKLQAGARKSIEGLKETTKQLRKPMSDLNKAVSRKPSMKIKMNLPKTSQKVKAQQVLARHKASEIKKAGGALGKYETPKSRPSSGSSSGPYYAGPDPLDIYMGFMIADMLSHSHHHHAHGATEVAASAASVDASVLNDTIGISPDVAAGAGVDLENLSPDLSAVELEGLGGAFNDASLDLGNLDVGDIGVGDLDLGGLDISMPDIDFGGIDIGGIDF